MKVVLILATNKSHSPYVSNYINILEQKGVDFDVVSWNKHNITEENIIGYSQFSDLKKSRAFRIKSYFNYRKFVLNVLAQNKYDRVIVFTVFMGILLYPYLKKEFKKLYVFDIRDYSVILKFIPKVLEPIIKNSFCTTISSQGFLIWLPASNNYVISHNHNFDNKKGLGIDFLSTKKKHIILTIGALRDYEANKLIIDSFKNDENFSMKFVGKDIAYDSLVEYVRSNKIKNVLFTGWYDKKDEIKYLENVSLINIFMPKDVNSQTLMSNRFYLAINNEIPILVNGDSTQAEYVEKYNLGLIVDEYDDIKKRVLNYIGKFDKDKFIKGCSAFLSEINEDQTEFKNMVSKFVEKQ